MSQFNAPHFQSHEAAREYLEGLRWGGERVCPHCGTVGHSYANAKKPGVYRCGAKECRKDFTVTTKSVMESSHIKLHIWLQAFYLMASSKKGISAHQLHRTIGCTYKTAWFLAHRIREAMRAGGLMAPFMGSGGKKHLHRYLSEFDFRYSNRVALGIGDGERADLAIKGAAGKRLTYRQSH
jgi:transposase-like protein